VYRAGRILVKGRDAVILKRAEKINANEGVVAAVLAHQDVQKQTTTASIRVRAFSAASMTIVEGKIGVIVFDTLATPGAALGAL
jgi:alkyl sulfatase BDS1-like metallo-beta-lactamase superfamily hydrolase